MFEYRFFMLESRSYEVVTKLRRSWNFGGVDLVELVFSNYVVELKNAWRGTIANENLIQLLYDSIVMPLSLMDKNDEYITVKKETASRLINRKDNVSPKIRQEVDNPVIQRSIVKYFSDVVIPEIFISGQNELLHKMMILVNGDSDISQAKKTELSDLAQKNTLAEFLANAFLYTIIRDNKIQKKSLDSDDDIENDIQGKNRKKPLSIITPPVKIAEEETPYIAALLDAYGEAESIANFDTEDLETFPKHKNHFIRQRGFYHLAEAVRRGTRDMYSDKDPDQFEVLKDETFEGVVEVWEDSYDNGLDRLRSVLSQAAVIRVDRCWLTRDTDWIGNPQKKGICHFLVNDNRLEGWVVKDED